MLIARVTALMSMVTAQHGLDFGHVASDLNAERYRTGLQPRQLLFPNHPSITYQIIALHPLWKSSCWLLGCISLTGLNRSSF